MVDHETIYKGLSQAAWGYFFLNFDFNLNTMSILPRFVGFILLYLAIDKLSGERRDLNLLRPLAVVLIVWSFGDWFLTAGGGGLEGHILFLDLLVTAATLYFHFQFLTDMAALAEQYQPEGDVLDGRIRSHRTAFTLLVTAVGLMSDLIQVFPWDWWPAVGVVMTVIAMIVALLIMADLFHLRKCVKESPEPQ